jgi:hypothetical protein
MPEKLAVCVQCCKESQIKTDKCHYKFYGREETNIHESDIE